ncbi:MAG: hypothetical protein LC685_00155 [Actinobacteria bacterium]|nr:hypothetical protein [Actinomycetota bacterium]
MEPFVMSARTRVADAPGAKAAVRAVESVVRRWNQFGIEALVGAGVEADGAVVVRYRLTVSGHADPVDVHRAFRGDLDAALHALSIPPPPVDWDLAALARAAAAQAETTPAELMYEDDAGHDWRS